MSSSKKGWMIPSWTLAVFACLLWSSAFAGVKTGLNYAPPLFFAGIRFLLAGIILVPSAVVQASFIRETGRNLLLVLKISLFQTSLYYAFFFLSLKLVPGSVGAVVNGMMPLWAALAAHIMLKDDKMSFPMIISLCIGFTGILLISLTRNSPSGVFGGSELIGVLLMLGASFSGVIGHVLVYRTRGSINAMVLTSSQFIAGGVTLLLLSRFIEGSFVFPLQPEFWYTLIYLGFLSATAFSIWYHLLSVRGEKVSLIGLWQFLIPVGGAGLSWLLIPGDTPSWPVAAGMALIAGAIIFFFVFPRKKEQNKELPPE